MQGAGEQGQLRGIRKDWQRWQLEYDCRSSPLPAYERVVESLLGCVDGSIDHAPLRQWHSFVDCQLGATTAKQEHAGCLNAASTSAWQATPTTTRSSEESLGTLSQLADRNVLLKLPPPSGAPTPPGTSKAVAPTPAGEPTTFCPSSSATT